MRVLFTQQARFVLFCLSGHLLLRQPKSDLCRVSLRHPHGDARCPLFPGFSEHVKSGEALHQRPDISSPCREMLVREVTHIYFD